MTEGLKKAMPGATMQSFPLADGGEGTLNVLTQLFSLDSITVEVHDPLFRKIESVYGINEYEGLAVVEMAKASGLGLLDDAERNCLKTSTLGTGELIADALSKEVKHIILTVGGSATNDGGIGMAHALGYKFIDDAGEALEPVGENLSRIRAIDASSAHPRIRHTKFTVLTDVTNPLYGPEGAVYVYALQKGAPSDKLPLLDHGLRNLSSLWLQILNQDFSGLEGGGAAGGLGAGAAAFLNARIKGGAQAILSMSGFTDAVKKSDVVITGEGKLDKQSLYGKVVGEVCCTCRREHRKAMAVAGQCELTVAELREMGLGGVVTLTEVASLQEALANSFAVITEAVSPKIATLLRQIV